MKKRKILSALLASVMIIGSLGGCGSSSSDSKSEKIDDTQELNTVLFNPLTFDSTACYDSDSSTIIDAIQEGLVRVSNDGNKDKIEPAGAESWEVSDDGLEYTFKLRKNKWSDGKEVVAQHYVDAVTRLLTASNSFRYAFFGFSIKNGQAFYQGKVGADQLGIKAEDDYTLKITLEKPEPYFLSKLSNTVFMPVRLDSIQEVGDSYGKDYSKVVYCGPFKIDSYEKEKSMVLSKNDNYWDKDNVKLNKINMTEINEFSTQAQLFESKQLDISGSTQEYVEKWKEAADEGKWEFRKGDQASTGYFQFNELTKGPSGLMGNAKIRKAISLAIDREELTSKLYGRYTPAYGFVPKAVNIGDDLYRDVAEEPLKEEAEKAKDDSSKLQELFKEGLKELNKDTSNLKNYTIEYITVGQSELSKQQQEWFKQQLENKLGITVKVTVAGDSKLYQSLEDDHKYDICLGGWNADYNDPMTFLDMWASDSDNNTSGYSNKEYDELLATLDNETDNSKRLETYKKLEKILMDDAAMAPLFYQDTRQFIQNYVKNFQGPAFGPTYEFRWAYIQGKN